MATPQREQQPILNLFEFNLPAVRTRQLWERFDAMRGGLLSEEALLKLARLQPERALQHGAYQLLLQNDVVYVWVASDVINRLRRHHRKLKGRRNIRIDDLRFRCLLMHRNWAAVADQDLLISHYKSQAQAKWNGAGFGPKDIGRGRDGTEPSWFDRHYPISSEYPCDQIEDEMTVGALAEALKSQLPFTFRYELFPKSEISRTIHLKGVPRKARALIRSLVNALGPEWQSTIFRSHIILYKERRPYQYGEAILANAPE